MNLHHGIQMLVLGAGREMFAIRHEELRLMFRQHSDRAFQRGLAKFVHAGLLERVARGVYVNHAADWRGATGLGEIVYALRPDHLTYMSYETALADCGSLSQVPFWYTLATTGRGGEYRAAHMDILLRHTNRSDGEIVRNTVFDERYRVRTAHPQMALEDTRRAVPLLVKELDMETHSEVVEEWGAYRA